MEAKDIERALDNARKVSKVILLIFVVVGLVCVALAILVGASAVLSGADGHMGTAALLVPVVFQWAAFAVACMACCRVAYSIARQRTVFSTQTSRWFVVSAILLWIFAIMDAVWLPLMQQMGRLVDEGPFLFEVAQHGLDMGFNFNVGAVFAAGALTLIASLVHYASLLQQQADELW